jgi:hypothetical protein
MLDDERSLAVCDDINSMPARKSMITILLGEPRRIHLPYLQQLSLCPGRIIHVNATPATAGSAIDRMSFQTLAIAASVE